MATLGDRRALAGLRYVEVETSRLCNRTCTWCPNGHSNARRVQQLMDWNLYVKITSELGELDFGGFCAFHNFNEPLANERLVDEIRHLRQAVPHAKPAIYTNGDLLKADRLAELLALGVAYVRVTRYPHRADVAPTFGALERWLRQVGIADAYAWEMSAVRQGLAAAAEVPGSGARIEVIRPSIRTYNDRGGTAVVPVTLSARTAPCLMTATSVSVDYRGVMKMCCNVVPDSAAEHDRYMVANLAEVTLADAWKGERMTDWRARHRVADWSASPACRSCVQALPETRR
jgi:hypothetical protein